MFGNEAIILIGSLVPRLFPGRSCCQFWLLAVWKKRKVWEKQSRAWHQVDMRRAVPDHCNSQTLHWSASNLLNNELYWRCLLNVTVPSFWTRYYKKDLKIFVGHHPSHVYPHVYLTSCTWLSQDFPLRFCILPGNEAKWLVHGLLPFLFQVFISSLGMRLYKIHAGLGVKHTYCKTVR